MPKHIPDFMIIGAMKCATSTLHDQLNYQPGLFLTEPKEPNFFSNDEIYAQGERWYDELFAGSSNSDLLGESSTHYTKLPTYPETINRIRQYGIENIKLIYIIRHPIERLVSQYIHEWSQGFLSCPINEALDSFPELIQYSKYAEQIEPFVREFGVDNIKVHTFKSMMKHKQLLLEDVCEFIGYQETPRWNDGDDHSNKSSERVRKFPGYDFVIESKPMTFLRQNLVPKSVRNKIRESLTMKKRPVLTSENIERLTHIFDEDLVKLGRLLSVDIACKNFNEINSLEQFNWSEDARGMFKDA